jgi:hypothetical protein
VKQHTIRVSKDGYQDEGPQTAEIKKGEEAKLVFNLRQVPTVATLTIQGAAAGIQVIVDQKPIGTVGPDGSFSAPNVAPGPHTIELVEGHRRKQMSKSFEAGKTVQLGPPDVVLQAAKAPVKITVTPANAVVTYKTPDGKSHEAHGNTTLELEEGQYMFTGAASGHNDASLVMTVVAGRPNNVALSLTPKSGPAVPAGPVKMEQWAATSGWKLEDDWYLHRGGGLVLHPAVPSSGSFVFTARRSAGMLGKGRIQWVVGCIEDKSSYILFGIDKKSLHRAPVVTGKKGKEENQVLKTPAKDLEFTMRVDISSDSVVTYVQQGGDWEKVDTLAASGLNPTGGKFGFYLPNTDELYISNFSFTPK